MGTTRAEITFYSQDQASVFLDSAGSSEDQGPDELRLFVHYVLRQFANSGPDQGAMMLGQALSKVGYEPGQDSIREMLDTVRVVPASGKGRRGFEATLDESGRFNLKPRGFGLTGKGIGYYSPVSVLVLLDYLWANHAEDGPFLNGLIMALIQLSIIGQMGTTSPTNQATLAESILNEVIPIYEREKPKDG